MVERRTLSIRRATNGDAPGILETLRAAFEDYRDSYTPQAFLDSVLTLETIGHRLSDMSVFVAIDENDEIAGTVGCNVLREEEGHIRGMAVRPTWQGAGVATQLLHYVESVLRDMHCVRISLDTTEPLTQAMRLYEKNGFCRSGKVSDFFGMKLFEYVKVLSVGDTIAKAEAQPGRGSNAESDPGRLLGRSDSGTSKPPMDETNTRLVEEIFRDAKFIHALGIELVGFGYGWCETKLAKSARLEQQHGFVHAGALMTLADHTCGGAAASTMPEGQDVITVENKVSFLRPATGQQMMCRATVLRSGRTLVFVEAEIVAERDGTTAVVAKASSTLAVIPRRASTT